MDWYFFASYCCVSAAVAVCKECSMILEYLYLFDVW